MPKFYFRYTALGLGVLWGAYRLRQIREHHADLREWEHEKAVAKAAVDAKQKKWLAKDEMRYLMKVFFIHLLGFVRSFLPLKLVVYILISIDPYRL